MIPFLAFFSFYGYWNPSLETEWCICLTWQMNKCVNNSLLLNIILAFCTGSSLTWAKDKVESNYLFIACRRVDCKERHTAPGKANRHENIGFYLSWTFHGTIICLRSAAEAQSSHPNVGILCNFIWTRGHPPSSIPAAWWGCRSPTDLCINSDGWLRYPRASHIASGTQVRQLNCFLSDWNSLQATRTTAKQLLGLCSGSR